MPNNQITATARSREQGAGNSKCERKVLNLGLNFLFALLGANGVLSSVRLVIIATVASIVLPLDSPVGKS
jgi:hypothetical protein